MRTAQTTAEHPLAYYELNDGEVLRISALRVNVYSAYNLGVCAAGIHNVLRKSWNAKLVDTGIMPKHAAVAKMPSIHDQVRRIQEPRTSYLITALGRSPVQDPDDVRAFARVSYYRPKRPTLDNPLCQRYPNITDLETPNGTLQEGAYRTDALALAYHALLGSNRRHKAAAHTEAANDDGVGFYTSVGFVERNQPTEIVAGSPEAAQNEPVVITYSHMEALHAGEPIGVLRQMLSPYIRQ